MRVILATTIGCLFSIPLAGGTMARDTTKPIENTPELSETVNQVFSESTCTRISEHAKGGGESDLAVKFRFRCDGGIDEVTTRLDALREVDGLVLEDVVNYPGRDPGTDRTFVDVRFSANVFAGLES